MTSNTGLIDIVPADIGRVFMNLFNNAFYSVAGKKEKLGRSNMSPHSQVMTKRIADKVEIE